VSVSSAFVPLQSVFVSVSSVFAPVQSVFAPVQSVFVPVSSVFVPVTRVFVSVSSGLEPLPLNLASSTRHLARVLAITVTMTRNGKFLIKKRFHQATPLGCFWRPPWRLLPGQTPLGKKELIELVVKLKSILVSERNQRHRQFKNEAAGRFHLNNRRHNNDHPNL